MIALLALAAQTSPWAGAKEGDFAKYAHRTRRSGMGDKEWSVESQVTIRVKSAAKDKIVLETAYKGRLGTETREQTIALAGAESEKGTEMIVTAGREFACTVVEIGATREWRCKDAPGGVVKSQTGNAVWKLVRLSEKVKAAGREFDCTVAQIDSPELTATEWRCAGVPGGLVRKTWTDLSGRTWFEGEEVLTESGGK